ncbi:MAG: serine/threonine-protein kinase, partial [Thermoanaerobaculia bacterium]
MGTREDLVAAGIGKEVMTPERWVDVERLYYAALERNPDERAAFLTGACADEALRHEVESLFAYQAKARDFIETPAAHIRLASALRGLEQPSLAGRFVGRVFGCYQLETLIAAGGMGEVYRAVDTRLNRTVAIKTLPEHLSNDPERRERFTREAKIVSSLNHPHICTLYDVGMQDGIQYLVMEHIEGETLRKRLERGALPLARALEYAIQICDALDKAHRRGVIHRDLNPANVMLTSSGVKLLDFGLAGPRTPAGETNLEIPSEHRSEGLTADGTIMGTLPYISPEHVEGTLVDVRSDIFAFGAVAYEMITGIRAFRGESQAALMNAILNGDPQPIVELVPDVPLPLAQTLSRCLAKDPNERWQTANDLLFQLRSIASSPAALDAHESAARHRRRRIERALWTTVVVVSMVGMFLWA